MTHWNHVHGHSKSTGRSESPEYQAWCSMKRRCSRPSEKDRSSYTERGISVCERWSNNFEAFLADIGSRPSSKHSLDRIDNDRGYEPGNCQWGTKSQQTRNRRCTKLTPDRVQEVLGRIEHGESQASVARRMNVSHTTVWKIKHEIFWSVPK